MKVLVTGSRGYIGSHLVAYLREQGDEVDEIPHWGAPYPADRDHEVIYHLGALANVPDCETHPHVAMKKNVGPTADLMLAWSDAKIIYTSTSSHGNWYAATKKAAEALILKDKKNCVVQLPNIAGAWPAKGLGEAHDPETHLIPNLVKACLTGEKFKLYSSASHMRWYLHVLDCCTFLRLIVDSTDTVIKAPGIGSTTGDLVFMAMSILFYPLHIDHGGPRAGDVPQSTPASDHPSECLEGWRGIPDMIRSQAKFMQERLGK